jgi:hypothetical protein
VLTNAAANYICQGFKGKGKACGSPSCFLLASQRSQLRQVEVAERVEGWKARQWARKLEQLQGQNAEQFKGLAAARTRILDLEQTVAAIQLKHEAQADKQALLRKPTSQVCVWRQQRGHLHSTMQLQTLVKSVPKLYNVVVCGVVCGGVVAFFAANPSTTHWHLADIQQVF